MSELYLILHKVRGEPTFDIAIREWYADEEGWMLKTIEQRCWPYWYRPFDRALYDHISLPYDLSMPDDIPDFYFQPPKNSEPHITQTTARDLLAKLGLGQKPGIKRRSLGRS